ncbi:haloacid dehalogenase superfamily, subfamily IA, variant 3 with third motif having DD or ED [Geodermatophilus dictyosporus]|uniref:Haloacid dehalogenase superfamily, subfamily IA, variant 3 with third motif having DD or ED n=1 Tax=Geodermatophilus dictyosporus TaxID=1523247 RepID=A0A1I5KKI3_9ACTN|nr:HAD family hydrolase [Geodermatophilus dictyosporus]SFO85584.1 haloacid dehalogenase superfamily, subfamily IA, variant 3 with third motif having DD or ED [Geodermatophilus dictyosporus]
MTPEKRPGVLLDVDGTLLDTNYLQVLAWWQAFRDTGHDDVSMAECHRSIGIGSAELVTHLLGDDAGDVDEVMKAKSRRYEPLREQVVAFPRVDELLAACRERELAVVLATSGEESDLEWMVPAIGGEDVVDGSTTSGDVESAKPAPDLLRTAAEAHGLDPDRTVAVGDTIWDVRAARGAGFPVIALTCGGISRAELLEEGADEVYDDPADLLAHLDDSLVGTVARG